jgi:hypothetical protein
VRWVRRLIAILVADGELIALGRRKRSVVAYRIGCLDAGYAGRDASTSPSSLNSKACSNGSSIDCLGGEMTLGSQGEMTRGGDGAFLPVEDTSPG